MIKINLFIFCFLLSLVLVALVPRVLTNSKNNNGKDKHALTQTVSVDFLTYYLMIGSVKIYAKIVIYLLSEKTKEQSNNISGLLSTCLHLLILNVNLHTLHLKLSTKHWGYDFAKSKLGVHLKREVLKKGLASI